MRVRTLSVSIVILASSGACGRIGVELLPSGLGEVVDGGPRQDGSADILDGGDDAALARDGQAPDGQTLDGETPDGQIPDAQASDGQIEDVPDASCPMVCANTNGGADCSSGQCLLTCAIGYADCDGDVANGCETSIAESVASCGECAASCTNPNGATMCGEGVCVPVCSAGVSGDCDGDPRNGCEADLTSAQYCGSCDQMCANEHGTTRCVDGRCAPSCDAAYASCDGDASNGCETHVGGDPMNCGGCGVTCDTSFQVCMAGSCQVSTCPAGNGDCDSNPADCETDTRSTVGDCGFCGNVCSVANGTPSCVDSACEIASCNAGFADCDGRESSGCEASLSSSVAHCGGCGIACSNAHGSASCSGGTCAPTCASGWGSCDGNANNGCETALDTLSHCGACGRVCQTTVADATAVCEEGVCESVCNDLSGVYALKIDVPVSWPATEYVRSGSGTVRFWARMALSVSGTSLTGTVTTCGRAIPDSENSVTDDRYGLIFPSSLFDQALPATSFSGTLGDTGPGGSLSLGRTALVMGVSLSDPINDGWPSLSETVSIATDHDGDGRRGVTAHYRSDGSYEYVPTSSSWGASRATRVYLSERLVFSLSGSLSSCERSSGTALAERVDIRRVGCLLDSGWQCSSSQYGHLDENAPTYRTGTASYVFDKLAPNGTSVSCADVRAALP